MVLYSASVDGEFLSLADLPVLPSDALNQIETITGPTGVSYTLSTKSMIDLRRYKMAMNVFVDTWVAKRDTHKMLTVILERMKVNPGMFLLVICQT